MQRGRLKHAAQHRRTIHSQKAFHPCTSFSTPSVTYAMMESRTSTEGKHQ
jgi:hypothetical protein